ncbi:MAG: pantoate--beta-alanine ligase [Bacteroidetes bacterium]|nr:MAG: pantoate--beta-alanine ligase [Bacteroidota bacterium]
MIVYRTKTDLTGHLLSLQNEGKSIGLVPTMGALHQGHMSLVEKAAAENDVVVVTIFVNPTQFNDPSDLDLYPRTLDQDLELLRQLEADLVFVPAVKEMYPDEETQVFDLGGLDKVMEGKHRPGHFNGVAQIVSKLFLMIRPHRAYFGQKDFQQLVVIRRLVEILDMNLTIVSCPIIREKDGLAMSSRNTRLSKEERKLAPFIYETLVHASELLDALSPSQLKEWVILQFKKQGALELEYFEIVEDKGLIPVNKWDEEVNKVACLAVLLGGVRLIDNLIFD